MFFIQKYIYFLMTVTTVNICTTYFNPLTPELNPSAQRCLTRFITGDSASWTVYFVNICVKSQQMQKFFIQFINYVWYLLHVSALYCHPQGAFLVPSERCSMRSSRYNIVDGCGHPQYFPRIFLLEILIFKGLTAWRLYKSFGVKR
jgi:hypothetical protein